MFLKPNSKMAKYAYVFLLYNIPIYVLYSYIIQLLIPMVTSGKFT